MGLDKLVKTLVKEGFDILKKEFPDNWEYLNKKLADPYEYFKNIDDYQKPVSNLKNEDFLSIIKGACPCDEKVEKTKEKN